MSEDQANEHIRVDLDGAVAVITMAKPPHNLLNERFIEDLLTAFEDAPTNGARAILLRSEMKHFSAGADVDGFGSDGGDGVAAVDVLDRFGRFLYPHRRRTWLGLGGGLRNSSRLRFHNGGSLIEARAGRNFYRAHATFRRSSAGSRTSGLARGKEDRDVWSST